MKGYSDCINICSNHENNILLTDIEYSITELFKYVDLSEITTPSKLKDIFRRMTSSTTHSRFPKKIIQV